MTGPRRPDAARCTVCDLDVTPGRVTNGVCDKCRSGHVTRFPRPTRKARPCNT